MCAKYKGCDADTKTLARAQGCLGALNAWLIDRNNHWTVRQISAMTAAM
jgi:hypothetical protein